MMVEPSVGCCSPSWGGGKPGAGEHRWDEMESYFCPMGSGSGVLWQWDSQLLRQETCHREKCLLLEKLWHSFAYTFHQSSSENWKKKKCKILLFVCFCPYHLLMDFWKTFDDICRSTQPLACFIHTLYLRPVPHQSDPWRQWSVWLWSELAGLRLHRVVVIK